MNRLEILTNEKKNIISLCLEKDTSLYATKQRIIDYNEALRIKDKNERIKQFIYNSVVISIIPLLITLLIYKSGFSSFFFENIHTYFKINKYIALTSVFAGTIKTSSDYIVDLQKYKEHGKRYNDLSVSNLREKVHDLTQNQKQLEIDLEKLKSILNYLKNEIEKEEYIYIIKRVQTIKIEALSTDYKNIHLNEYEIPKVKVKRRNENDTKAKRYI